MELNKYVRKPFLIEAVEVTKENIGEVAKLVGTLRQKNNGDPYIQVDRLLVPSVDRVYPGFWMTKMSGNIRCYANKTFLSQFVPSTPEIEAWVDFLNEEPQVNEESA